MLLTKLSQFLSKYTTPVVLLFAAVAFIYAPSFAWVKGETQTIILGVIMFAMGLTLSPKDFAILAKRPGDILLGTLAQFTIMPLIAFTLVHLGLPKGIAIVEHYVVPLQRRCRIFCRHDRSQYAPCAGAHPDSHEGACR